ncbi:formate dehydrogenase accessory sulfurtransferase FdhD [Candidatus Poribacteria bacterium]|nr:MAG: formate dehydrogenase accessory sulfurtransferase FdhD [Candidatus Poribacteria bacterium]
MKKLKILRWRRGEVQAVEDLVAEEGLLRVDIGGTVSFDALITPEKIRPFVYGHLLTEGLIESVDDVLDYFEYVKGGIVHVKVRLRRQPPQPFHRSYNVVWTECGHVRLLDEELRPPKGVRVSARGIIDIPRLIRDEVGEFRLTGAYHYAFLFDPDLNLRAKAKDIGRHNAVDKAIGEELLRGAPLSERILYTTGRVTVDIVLKCLRSGVPLLISRSAPLSGAVELASRYGLGLIGFLRGERFNIYSGEEMITP